MIPRVAAFLLIAIVSSLAADPRGDEPDAMPSTPEQERAMFHLPPGFEIQLVAAEPEIQKPINLTFDGAGRLWVTGSEMYPWPAGTDAHSEPIPNFEKSFAEIASAFHVGDKAPKPSSIARDTVRVLSDFDATGRAKRIKVFADGLNIPSGVQPLPRKPGAKGDTVIVYSIPTIWRLEDTDGDGVADKREPLFKTFGFLDTHGGSSSYLYWIDGWIYGTHGFRNHSEVTDRSGHTTVLDSGNTYRFRPDGSRFEIYTHGQTNPFGLTVDPLGNFYTADSHSKPVYMLLRGGFYEGIGKQHDGLGFAPRITTDDHGSTAIAGITFYADDKWPEEFRGNLFNGNVVTRRINRDRLEWHGSTPQAVRMPDFLTSDDPWFRPVQVKLGPDGALYIADFYNPIIGHYEFPLADPRRDHTHGRIWRIVYRGEKKADANAGADASGTPTLPLPDLTKLDAAGLVEKLADPNLLVRTLATNELVERVGKEALPLLIKTMQPDGTAHGPGAKDPAKFALPFWEKTVASQRAHALWAVQRLEAPAPGANSSALGPALGDAPEVRVHALRVLRDYPMSKALYWVIEALRGSDANLRRAAADVLALTDSGHPDISEFLRAWDTNHDEADTELIYDLRLALRDQLTRLGAFAHAREFVEADSSPAVLKRLHAERLADVSVAVPTAESADFLLAHLARTKLQGARSGEFLRHAVLYLPPEKLGAVAGLIKSVKDAPLPQRLSVADNLAQAYRQRGINPPGEITLWMQGAMIEALASADESLLKRAIESVREARLDAKLEPLVRLACDTHRAIPLRISALEALANLAAAQPALVRTLTDSPDMPLRKRAAELLGQKSGDAKVIEALLTALPKAPTALANTIAGALAKNATAGTALIELIEAGKAPPTVLRDKVVATALEKLSPTLR